MFEAASLKPYLTALLMPPASLLLLIALCLLLQICWPRFRPRLVRSMAGISLVLLWLLSTQAVAVWLAPVLLPSYAPLNLAKLPRSDASAIVVLGGGIELDNPEYGGIALESAAYQRLRYGYAIKRATGLPLGYSGGYGWSSRADAPPPMAQALAHMLAQDGRAPLDWVEGQSRDTHENARNSAALLLPRGIHTVYLVTHAWHMPRSVRAFEAAGLLVIPAPMGFVRPADSWAGQWLPSGKGMQANYALLREWLGLRMRAW